MTDIIFKSSLLKWTGLTLALIIAGVSLGLGLWQQQPLQQIILYTIITFATVVWVWSTYTQKHVPMTPSSINTAENKTRFRDLVKSHRRLFISLVLLIVVFVISSLLIPNFFSPLNIISMIVLTGLLLLSTFLSRFVVENKSVFIGLIVLVGLIVIGALKVEGFIFAANIKSMLLFAAFLGLASIGQTLVALLGGLDLSIPFVIGSSNVGLLYLIGLGVPSWLAVIIVLILGSLIGMLNGFLSFRLQGQALILTLGVGFAVSGTTQILTSLGSSFAGNVFGRVPSWLSNLAAMNGSTFGLEIPPVIIIWIIVSILLILGMKHTVYGRYLYAIGGNRISAKRLSISERRYWIIAFSISGFFSTLTGALLLGWSGGGFIGVGKQYLFMTLAAVVMGGTSLLGGTGGYGYTVIGVLVLQVLTSFLVGIGLNYQWQQFIFGLLILPMVALYARSPHIRTSV